jgi:hypothetical protein
MSRDEAAVFGYYLVGRDIDQETRALYARAARELQYDVDDAASAFAKKHRWAIPALDGALAFANPHAPLRKKLLLLAAILEVRPEYADLFLPQERAPLYLIFIAARVVRAWILAVAGLILLLCLR